ncbi:hypothetical protein LTR62_005496 [Meristemomyces frigidus]|uniref:Uncharacterized protein n=1 Tax=Meristemomyces frigidus TaxID=1508187 RepID=A0AAN7YJB6_9PEZI|nr:hypothetical protein LTR62_005496 [Meristemomyces frigidus]
MKLAYLSVVVLWAITSVIFAAAQTTLNPGGVSVPTTVSTVTLLNSSTGSIAGTAGEGATSPTRSLEARDTPQCSGSSSYSYADVENAIQDYCATIAGQSFSAIVYKQYDFGWIAVELCAVSHDRSFTQLECLENFLTILWECPESNGLGPLGTLEDLSDCFLWGIYPPREGRRLSAGTVAYLDDRAAAVVARPEMKPSDAKVAPRVDVHTCGIGPVALLDDLDMATEFFCNKHASGNAEELMSGHVQFESFAFTSGIEATFERSSPSDISDYELNSNSLCVSGFGDIVQQCQKYLGDIPLQDLGSAGGSATVSGCVNYNIALSFAPPRNPKSTKHILQARQTETNTTTCSCTALAVSADNIKQATDNFCQSTNGLTLKRNDTISEQILVRPIVEGGSTCVKANATLTNGCFDFFTWYKPCEASFDAIAAKCDTGTVGDGGTFVTGDDGCIQYILEMFETAEDC